MYISFFQERGEREMFRKANQLMIAAYVSVTGYMQNLKEELKNDERGLSGIVVAVMLILVAVLAVVLLWGKLSEWLDEFWKKILDKSKEVQ